VSKDIDLKSLVNNLNSPKEIYELFRLLNYPDDKLLDPSYKRNLDSFEIPKEDKDRIKELYTVFNYEGKLQIFLLESKVNNRSFIRSITKHLSDRFLRFLLILTTDFKEYSFIFPEFELVEAGKHKLKLTTLNLDKDSPYYTDLLTIQNLALTGDEKNWKDIYLRWKSAFSVEKVTNKFFEDYKSIFFDLRNTFLKQNVSIKQSHELAQQILNRLMFLYFIAKKGWLDNNPKFIKWFYERYKEEKRKNNIEKDTFYSHWVSVLFLQAFNNQYSHPNYLPKDIDKILANAPYLNGGLFKKNDLDDLDFEITDELFEKILNFFEKYNFTIREDLPLDVEVAVDPKMIGYVYESLSNVAEEIYERQDLGIFYTPTIEVDFMCRRTLVEYLSNHIRELPKDKIYHLLFDDDKKISEDFITERNLWYKLEDAFDNLAIVDPACGSGAFLVGMLNVLAELYRLTYKHIKREMTDFELKKKIIGNSLYGVDIMPWAVHSAELRLWLQLIIEEDIPYEIRKLYPLLPNLNMKLRVGDSLVQELGGVNLHIRDSNLSPGIKRKLTNLKIEKEKYYNNDPTRKFKTDEALRQEEVRIFIEILDDKIFNLQKEIQKLQFNIEQQQLSMFGEDKKVSKQKTLFEESIKKLKQEIETLKATKNTINLNDKKPFIWDIDFAEIFGEKGGFDIVIGNPPYVRQEKIAPPNKLRAEVSIEDKREYKEKLLKSIQAHYPFIKKLDKKSDYYIYFYFHGLSLLNEKGVFCFITSNSWLDVGYGKDLQEFLLKYCHLKAIYDNEARRSFEHADVNTIIALFGVPETERKDDLKGLNKIAKFVMFKKPFEEVINTKNLIMIENAQNVIKTESFRVYPVKQETLLEEGFEVEEDLEKEQVLKEGFKIGTYKGGKWGGKYLRAPDIFFTILEKGKDKLIRLGDIAEVRFGIKTGCNEFFYLKPIGMTVKEVVEKSEKNPEMLITVQNGAGWEGELEAEFLKPVIKSPRELKTIEVRLEDLNYLVFMCHKEKKDLEGTNALKYIEWGQKQGVHKRPTCASRPKWWDLGVREYSSYLWTMTYRERFFVLKNNEIYVDARLYDMFCNEEIGAISNSTLCLFCLELQARNYGGGGGPVDVKVYEIMNIQIPTIFQRNKEILIHNFRKMIVRPIHSIFTELGIDPSIPIREQKPNPLPDRKALDDIIFDILGLTEEERNEVYYAVCELVHNRLAKARSV